jgi:hypothetical protein
MSLAIPGARGLFSFMREALKHPSDSRIRLSRNVHDCLDNVQWLAATLASRPTRLFEITPQDRPELLGAGDACERGMGGVWFPNPPHIRPQMCADDGAPAPLSATGSTPPILWHAAIPAQRCSATRQ